MIQSIVVACFLLSFVACNILWVRQMLYVFYILAFLIWVVYYIIFVTSTPLPELVDEVNEWIIDKTSIDVTTEIADFIKQIIWVIIGVYALIIFLIKIIFINILYLYMKELKEKLELKKQQKEKDDKVKDIFASQTDEKKENFDFDAYKALDKAPDKEEKEEILLQEKTEPSDIANESICSSINRNDSAHNMI